MVRRLGMPGYPRRPCRPGAHPASPSCSSLDLRPGKSTQPRSIQGAARTDEPHDQGARDQALPLGQPRPAQGAPAVVGSCLQPCPPPPAPAPPDILRVHWSALGKRARPVQAQPVTPHPANRTTGAPASPSSACPHSQEAKPTALSGSKSTPASPGASTKTSLVSWTTHRRYATELTSA